MTNVVLFVTVITESLLIVLYKIIRSHQYNVSGYNTRRNLFDNDHFKIQLTLILKLEGF